MTAIHHALQPTHPRETDPHQTDPHQTDSRQTDPHAAPQPARVRRRTLAALGATALAAALAACGTTGSADPAPDGFYRVERGDTLYSIARRHRRSVAELARWNNLASPDQIEVGQLIRVRPAGATAAAAERPARTPERAERTPQLPQGKVPTSTIRLQWPAEGRITGRFAPPGEKGIRIAVPAGGKVRAAASGWAIHVGNMRGYGMLVIVKHNDDWLTVYGNLDKPLVKENAQVAAGQDIGTMGADAELHFEVRGGTTPVDPLRYLPAHG
ncbi:MULTISPECIES: peptidoglycan DD-metalloendopeptidase family protein [unclassified Cupriavidus]|uniref:peptidoglycan DD-metalloendopeptidase family protein n=1 Tax=Cupriavidus sp. H19C3 TaxID=3241603 RepID=UPI003BF9118E